MNLHSTIITIDGPAGSGKSTICKEIARRYGLIYIDSGAIYRSIAYALMKGNFLPSGSEKELPNIDSNILAKLPLTFEVKNGAMEIRMNDKVLSHEIRTPEVSMFASKVSQLKPVRILANEVQRRIACRAPSVVDGRDAATVVFPDACLKVYLIASVEVRAARRLKDYQLKGIDISYEQVLDEIKKRDFNDSSRENAPLKAAEDAVIIDTSDMTIQQVVDSIIKLAKDRCPALLEERS